MAIALYVAPAVFIQDAQIHGPNASQDFADKKVRPASPA
jgi:hypothetical protein